MRAEITQRLSLVGAVLGQAREGLRPGEDHELLAEIRKMLENRTDDVQRELISAAVIVH